LVAPTTPSDRLEPFITNPAETVPTAPATDPDLQQGNSSPNPVPTVPPPEPPRPKQSLRERIALLEHEASTTLTPSATIPAPVLTPSSQLLLDAPVTSPVTELP
jgi:hypothetical protein